LIAHTRVLPVDDPDPVAVVDEIGVQQVVVAWRQLDRRRQECKLDPTPDRLG
jgi:hypothetical protein